MSQQTNHTAFQPLRRPTEGSASTNRTDYYEARGMIKSSDNALDGRVHVGRQFHSPEWKVQSQLVPENEERLKLMTTRAIPPSRPPPPTSFQDILPPSLITSPTSSNGSVSPKSPQDSQLPKDNTSARSRFAQLARKAALPKMKGVVDSLRSSKSREKPSKPDPVAVALMWAESASTSKTSLSDTSSSNVSHEMTHDPNHIAKSHSIHSNLAANNHHTNMPWNKAQMSSWQTSDPFGSTAETNTRKEVARHNRKTAPIRTVRFKEEEEFIPTPPWTPSSSTWSLNSTDYVDRSSTDDHDDYYPWEDDLDTRPNETLALAAIERTPVTHGHLRGNPGLRIIPPHTNVISTVT